MSALDSGSSYCRITSAVSTVILKPVHQFGIPSSDPQTLKSVDFWCKLSSPFVITEPWEQSFELFRIQNSQNFPWLHLWISQGKAYNTPSLTSQLQNIFSPCYLHWKTGTHKKLLDTALIKSDSDIKLNSWIIVIRNRKMSGNTCCPHKNLYIMLEFSEWPKTLGINLRYGLR